MKTEYDYKPPNGKLLRISLEYDEKKRIIQNIQITGDFFIYPEEGIEELEKNLRNTLLLEKNLFDKISSTIDSNNLIIIGFTVEDLVGGILGGICRDGKMAST
ncbi:MAG: hypothetical protein DRN12_06345 [Thermoplasmata archaeon]|nr:MAG: hypothetical protein DRN12_06345 [Thermoplasmata archaeon]